MTAKASTENKQYDRFVETARALGCDEDEAAFDEKLKAVVGPKVRDVTDASPQALAEQK